jgi:hypothetical protein
MGTSDVWRLKLERTWVGINNYLIKLIVTSYECNNTTFICDLQAGNCFCLYSNFRVIGDFNINFLIFCNVLQKISYIWECNTFTNTKVGLDQNDDERISVFLHDF